MRLYNFVPLVDVRLKGILSKLKFNELVKAALFYGGNQEFPHEYVLSELTAVATVPSNGIAGTGPSLSGLLLSYRGPVEYVNVYNDGTILYQDVLFNRFATQKLSPDELAQVLGTFAAQIFSSLPSTPPTGDLRAYRNSLTLIWTRLQTSTCPVWRRSSRRSSLAWKISRRAPLHKLSTYCLNIWQTPSEEERTAALDVIKTWGRVLPSTRKRSVGPLSKSCSSAIPKWPTGPAGTA